MIKTNRSFRTSSQLTRNKTKPNAHRFVSVLAFCSATLIATHLQAESPKLELNTGDKIAIIGNTFAERTGEFGFFETIVSSRFPEHNLTFRNLAWSADTVSLRPRPLNFGDIHTHLERVQADVVIACFGMTESFDGPEGLTQFEAEYNKLVEQLLQHKYNGSSPPRLILVSPIPHEKINRYLPDPAEHNASLQDYSTAVEKVAAGHQLTFVDLWNSLQPFINGKVGTHLTFNGIHQSEFGDWLISLVMARELGWLGEPEHQHWDAQQKTGTIPLVKTTSKYLPLPLPPPGHSIPRDFRKHYPRTTIENLRPGFYELKFQNEYLAEEKAEQWSEGITVKLAPEFQAVEKLRQTILEKNRQFFYRWRAVNGEYIYGRRKEPFGVISYPPEMKKLDEMIQQLDRTIWYQTHPRPGARFELVPAS